MPISGTNDIRIFIGGTTAIYSDDHGATWNSITFAYQRPTVKPCFYTTIFAAGTNGVIYAFYKAYNLSGSDPVDHFVFEKSTDYGANWSIRHEYDYINYYAIYPLREMKVSNFDNSIVYVGGREFKIFDDNNPTIPIFSTNMNNIHHDIRDIFILNQGNSEKIFVASDGGVGSVTVDPNDPNKFSSNWSWSHHYEGLQIQQVYSFDFESDKNHELEMYMGLQDNGTVKYEKGEFSFTGWQSDGGNTLCNPFGEGVIYQSWTSLNNYSNYSKYLGPIAAFDDPVYFDKRRNVVYTSGQEGNRNMSAVIIDDPFLSAYFGSASHNINPNFNVKYLNSASYLFELRS